MEHPPKQGLKHVTTMEVFRRYLDVLMEHPPKQGLKPVADAQSLRLTESFNGTSTKTRIETAFR